MDHFTQLFRMENSQYKKKNGGKQTMKMFACCYANKNECFLG